MPTSSGRAMPDFGPECLTACLLHNEPASYCHWQGEASCRAVAKASLNRATESVAVDAKRDDLPMARVKLR